jgi:hypothetical protein
MRGHSETGIGGWKRPQSARNSYFAGGDHSSSATSECEDTSGSMEPARFDGTHRRNKLAAKFPLLSENVQSCVTENELPNRQTVDNNLTGWCQLY